MMIQNIFNPAKSGVYISDEIRSNALPTVVKANPPPQSEAVAKAPSANQLQRAVDNINQLFRQSNTNLEFSVDDESQKTVVKMLDSSTGELIYQYPSKVAIAISNALDSEMKTGVLLSQKA